jgi:antirestriction protein ArdC
MIAAPPITVTTPIEQAEAFVAATGAAIHHGGGRAFYRPSTDSIHLPPREAFISTQTSTPAESYFSTLCHELCHWGFGWWLRRAAAILGPKWFTQRRTVS